ncbi:unnamed protein product [Clavelina lepadiformis]|uniref:TIR domain-containing protein n=1 Tax=Clavelina lepadiformis TaxID=159417 RepID=A0ABP0F444_CLALP
MAAIRLILFVFLLMLIRDGTTISIVDPCDDMTHNITIAELDTGLSDIYDDIGYPQWMLKPLKFILCSSRGLSSVPETLSDEVEILNLQINVIRVYRKNNFRKYANLVALMLDFNCAARATEQGFPVCHDDVTIEAGTFVSLRKLKYLNLQGNNMASLPELPCSLKYLGISQVYLNAVTTKEMCFRDLDVLDAFDNYNDVQGDLPKGRKFSLINNEGKSSKSKLRSLKVRYNNWKHVPVHLFNRNILILDLSSNPIGKLRQNDFRNIPKVKYLYLREILANDRPAEFNGKMFQYLLELEFLDLSQNSIHHFSDDLFVNNIKLKHLDLRENCLWRYVANPTFIPWQNLEYLDISLNGNCLPGLIRPTTATTSSRNSSREKESAVFNNETAATSPTSSSSLLVLRTGVLLTNATGWSTSQDSTTADITTVEPSVDETAHERNTDTVKRKNEHLVLGKSYSRFWKLRYLYLGPPPKVAEEMNECYRHVIFHRINSRSFRNVENLINLTDVSLTCLSVLHLAPDSFVNLSALKNVYVSKNRLRYAEDIKKSRRHTGGKVEMKKQHNCERKKSIFDASHNSFEKIPEDMFQSIPFVTHIDISSNRLSSIQKNNFEITPCLKHLDLRGNLIDYVDPLAFATLARLSHLYMGGETAGLTGRSNFDFLANIRRSGLNLIFHYSNIFDPGYHSEEFLADKVTQVDLSHSDISIMTQNDNQEFCRHFPYLQRITMDFCAIDYATFLDDCRLVEYLSLQSNHLTIFPMDTFVKMKQLTILKMSSNRLTELDMVLVKKLPILEALFVSKNRIKTIRNGHYLKKSNSLRYLDVSNNYIKHVGDQVFPYSFLLTVEILDLRWNPVICECSMHRTFGKWFKNDGVDLDKTPGFFLQCTPSTDVYLTYASSGGCVQCTSDENGRSLVDYTILEECKGYFQQCLATIFSTFILVFMISGMAVKSKTLRRKVYEYIAEDIRKMSLIAKPKARRRRQNYIYHAFVVYDADHIPAGDWIEYELVPRLSDGKPSFHVAVLGKDDQCGMTPVKQLLFNLQASRKVILVITDNYFRSAKGQYIIAVLETLAYEHQHDKMILIQYESDRKAGGLIRNRLRKRPETVLTKPELKEDQPLFYSALRIALKSEVLISEDEC